MMGLRCPGIVARMAKKLAFMTVGSLLEPMGHPVTQGFMDRISVVFSSADASDGFVARSERDLQTLEHSWGPLAFPKCFGPDANPAQTPTTLSLWNDLESVAAFAYHGAHGEALSKRKEWFAQHDQPTYVAWWVEEGHPIDWKEAAERLDHLHEHGPTAFAFNMMKPFDATGNPKQLDAKLVRSKIELNEPS